MVHDGFDDVLGSRRGNAGYPPNRPVAVERPWFEDGSKLVSAVEAYLSAAI
jgi:hypothetical protein